MAPRTSAVADAAPEIDALDGLPLPRQRGDLVDQVAAERTLLEAYRSGRIHHGWILGGPKGIGKATLAFRFARFVLAHPDPRAPEVRAASDLSVDMESAVARRIAGGAHGDLLHLRRPWDEKNKRFKTDLPIDEIRRTVSFFGSTAGEGGWRLAIVDAADDLKDRKSVV
jgi:DNA polymerase-3 subunit delta'